MNMTSYTRVSPQMIQSALNAFNTKDYALADRLLREILSIDPTQHDANHLHGLIADLCGQYEAAKQLILKAIHFSPNTALYYDSLGTVFLKMGEFVNSEKCFRQAIELDNKFGQACNNLAGLLQKSGNIAEAENYYLKAHKLGQPWAYSNYLLMLNYSNHLSPEESLLKHQKWEKDYWKRHSGKPYTHKKRNFSPKLKIGYVSGDFKTHSVAYFFEPLLSAHNKSKVEVFCYYNHSLEDSTTERLKGLSDHWRNIEAQSDQAAANLIRKDGIDILVDLSGHSAYNRLGVFARKPAPVQITWLGYPNSTGLSTMDFRIVDEVTDPIENGLKACSERILRLDQGFLCYQGPEFNYSTTVPSVSKGYITFGSFNNLSKLNDDLIKAWVSILQRVPKSKLFLKSQQFSFPEVRDQFIHKFIKEGVDSSRLILQAHTATTEEHLNLYKEIDIALDTFPYNGTTTSCEALWMGVPVITLLGDRHVSRVSASILKHSQLEKFIATDVKTYIDLAVSLADNKDELSHLRSNLREKLKQAPITDKMQFARNIENAFKQAVAR